MPSMIKNNFSKNVLDVVKNIPKGSVLSYKEVAERAGNKKGARAVGAVLAKNYNKEIPCHRVIRSDGQLGGYNRGVGLKKKILKEEGYL